MNELILASASTARARLLAAAGVRFRAVPANIDEAAVKSGLRAQHRSHGNIAAELAERKAREVAHGHPGALVLGADQVLAFAGELVSKCANFTEARTLLERLRGQEHELITAVVLFANGTVVWRHVTASRLRMRAFGAAFLEDYMRNAGETILGSVGCYELEGLGAQLFEEIEGDYFSILGLPLLPLLTALRDFGVLAT
ncbi:MAG TPA: Maf family nucleotide pyrophosphatase [Rhizomicrobium sp.]|jgi:septum formation protein